MKQCTICKTNKELVEYNKHSKRRDGLQPACKDCNKAKSRAYYAANKEHQVQQITRSKKLRIAYNQKVVFDYLLKHPCFECGETDPRVLEFDHLTNKIKSVSQMLADGNGLTRIQNEIAKCQILCANCHRKKTAQDFEYYSHRLYLEYQNTGL